MKQPHHHHQIQNIRRFLKIVNHVSELVVLHDIPRAVLVRAQIPPLARHPPQVVLPVRVALRVEALVLQLLEHVLARVALVVHQPVLVVLKKVGLRKHGQRHLLRQLLLGGDVAEDVAVRLLGTVPVRPLEAELDQELEKVARAERAPQVGALGSGSAEGERQDDGGRGL